MLFILLLAAILRFQSVRFGLPAINDSDELVFELGAIKMLIGHSFNPGWFGHPATTTLYVLVLVHVLVFAVGHAMGWFPSTKALATAIYADPSWAILPARIVMVLFGIWCVYLTYRLGEKLFGRGVGLLSALLLAVDPVHVAYSQVVRSDIMATAFMLLMLLATLRYGREGRWRDLLLAALWLGAATTTKWPFAACGISFVAVGALRLTGGQDAPATALSRLVLFGAAAIVAVVAISPYLVLDHQAALRSVSGEVQVRHVGQTGQGVLWNAGWYLRQPLATAFGWFGVALAAAGIVLVARRPEPRALLLPLLAVLAAVTLTQNLIWVRWTLPLLPLLSILVAVAVFALPGGTAKRAPIAVAILLLFAPLLWQTQKDSAERLTDTRQAATRWAAAHIPPDASIIIEHFGFDLLSYPWALNFPLADAGCIDARAILRGKVQYSTIEALRGGHHNVDFGTLNPATRHTCGMRYAILSQYDRYMAEAPSFPVEVASYRELMGRSTILTTIRPVPGKMGGPIIRIIRIDRPSSRQMGFLAARFHPIAASPPGGMVQHAVRNN